MEHVQVLIAGGGIGGLSAAIWCHRLGLSCLLVEKSDHLGGQLRQIRNEIIDLPPRVYPHGSDLLEELQRHPAIQALHPHLEEAVFSVDPLTHIVTTNKNQYHADTVIIATGVSPNVIPALAGCSRVLSPAFSTTAQAASVAGQDIAVIGGGDRALESAANLCKYAHQVELLVRSDRLRASSKWVTRLRELPNLRVFWETQIDTYEPRAEQVALKLRSLRGDQASELIVDWVLPRVGVHANSDAFPALPTFDDGYLQTDEYQRAAPHWIYALGDVCNGSAYASLSLAVGQAMKAVKHISLQLQQP